MSNQPDITELAVDVSCSIAMAQLHEVETQSFRLADLVSQGVIDKARAVDILYYAAVGADLRRVHGDDVVQDLISIGFEVTV